MSRLTDECRYLSEALLIPIFALSHIVPRDKNLWVFGSTFGNRFADNPRYFFYYLSRMDEEERKITGLKKGEIRPVWITKNPKIARQLRNMGYEAYTSTSKEGIRCCLRAGVYIFDNYSKDISFCLSGGAKKINLWHGTPLKKIQMDNRFDKVRYPENLWKWFYWQLRRMSDEKPWHYVLTTSEFFRPIFSSAFATKNVLVCGYPRNDCLLGSIRNDLLSGEEKRLNALKRRIRRKNGCRVVFYMPTFRESETKFFDVVDFTELSRYLEEKNLCLVIKLHPKSKLQARFEEEVKMQGTERFLLLSNQDDPYEFLKMSDVLITDYSSVYFDWLVLDRPIIFFDYDRRDYLTKSRELYFDYDEFTPGMKAANWQELKKALNGIDWEAGRDGFERKRREIRELAVDDMDGHAGRRLLEAIKKKISRLK